MKKQILIPTDFSDNAYNATEYAFQLFENQECDFYIIHSYYLAGFSKKNMLIPEPDKEQYEKVKESSARNIENLEAKIKAKYNNPKHDIVFISAFGNLLEVLKENVEKYSIDLVIMGTRGKSEESDIAYGRNSVVVMEKIRSCPVMAIPANVLITEPKEIVFAASYKWEYREKEMRVFVDFCKEINASVKVLHVGKDENLSEKQKINKRRLEEFLAPLNFSFHWNEKEEVREALLKFIETKNSDMIVFVNRKHWFFGGVFSNPLVKNLGIHSTVPILALHDA